ncbi:4Fe-4S single cluster domain-containing protein [Mesorhizobium sp. 131-2-5]|uniref:4Fe-4S single cluster domain-containing protein n=1 Tax=Mesorhizobium sp. 131-2-5 TaxID=2744519 RepID=UPI0019251D96|nr:4Fe-4S single cluster domain-containing protein [Mesorhizobium sp. 131-2-5]
MTTPLALSRLHFPVTTLGPGSRIGIWFQGCSIRCAGCISADTWALKKGMTTVEQVMEAVARWLLHADGITISGGEPFDQPDALETLLRTIRLASRLDVLVYSGYPLEVLEGRLRTMDGLIDALISDPYDVGSTQTLALRGSDNQRLNLFTELGKARLASFERPIRPGERRLDMMVDPSGEVWMAGVPGKEDMNRLARLMASQGHRVETSQDRSNRASHD